MLATAVARHTSGAQLVPAKAKGSNTPDGKSPEAPMETPRDMPPETLSVRATKNTNGGHTIRPHICSWPSGTPSAGVRKYRSKYADAAAAATSITTVKTAKYSIERRFVEDVAWHDFVAGPLGFSWGLLALANLTPFFEAGKDTLALRASRV